jgi:hypothetical protein
MHIQAFSKSPLCLEYLGLPTTVKHQVFNFNISSYFLQGVPIYGTAQPTSYGINAVVQLIVANETSKTVHWCNLREEPVIYLNGTPYVLRSFDEPLKNVNHVCI